MRDDEPDWRTIDREKRSDDWKYAGEILALAPLMVFVGLIVACVFIGSVLIRCAPLIIAVFMAIVLAKCVGVV